MPTGISTAFGQSTPAMQARIGQAKRSGRRGGLRSAAGRRTRKKPGSLKTVQRIRKKRAKFAAMSKMKKGSAAAKKWGRKMARLRKK